MLAVPAVLAAPAALAAMAAPAALAVLAAPAALAALAASAAQAAQLQAARSKNAETDLGRLCALWADGLSRALTICHM